MTVPRQRAIPASNQNPDLKLNTLQEAVETGQGVRGNPLERYITVGDLVDAGIIKLLSNYRRGRIDSGNIGPVTPVPESIIPPTPTGLAAVGLFTAILVSWDEPQTLYSNHAFTKIYRATEDNIANGVAIGMSPGNMFADPVEPGITYYYWISFVSTQNIEGPRTPASVNAQASLSAEDLLEDITDAINEGMLAPELRARLDLIDFPDTGLVDKLNQEITDRVAAIEAEVDARAAAILAEALDRQGAIDMEAESRETLAAQMRGSYAGNDLGEVTTGLIAQERQARTDGHSALALQIALLSAGVGGAFDPYQTWYFESNAESWAGSGATVAWAQGAITVTSTGTDPQISLGSLNINGGAYDTIKMRVKRTGGSGWQGEIRYSTAGHSFSASYAKVLADPGSSIDDWATLEFDMSELTAGGTDWKDSTITGLRIDLGNTSSDVFVIDWIGVGRNAPAASVAQLLAEQQARATADSAQVTARDAIAVKVFGNTDPAAVPNLAAVASGLIAQERDARVTADSSEVTLRQALATKLLGTTDPTGLTLASLTAGLIYEERVIRSTQTGTLATDVSNINATLNHGTTGLSATRTRVTNVETRLSSTAGKSYETIVSEFNAAKAVIEDATTGNSALAQQVEDLEAIVTGVEGGFEAYVSETSALGARLTRGNPNLFANPDCEQAINSHLVNGTFTTASKHGGRRSIQFTNNSQGAVVWKQDESKGWPRFEAGQQFSLGYWARNATPYAATFGYGTPTSPFGHVSIPANTDWAFYQSKFTVPAGAMLADVSTTAAVRINTQTFSGTDSGEFYVHGFAAGVAADVDGTIIDVNGSTLTLLRAAGLTNLAGITGYICYDKAVSARFLVGGVYRRYALVFINASGNWVYDNNTVETAFTPDASMVLIGNMATGSADVLSAAIIWPQAVAFNGTSLPQPVLAPAFKLLTSGTTLTAGVFFDDLVLMRGSHTFDGATLYAPDGTPYALAERIRTTEATIEDIDGVLTEQVTAMDALQVMAGNDFALIQTLQTVTLAPGGLSAQFMLKTEVNGMVAGFGLYNSGAISDFGVNTDRFFIGAPSYIGRTTNTIYEIGAIRTNGGNTYKVVANTGDKRSGPGAGPTGTGAAIVDGNVTWKFVRAGTATPTNFTFVVDTAANAVRMHGASIVDATIDNAKILNLAAEKITGIDSTFVLAKIGTGNITNAYIGQFIQSYTYNPAAGQGWRIDKDGWAEFASVTIRGPSGEILFDSGQRLLFAGRSTNQLFNTTFTENTDGWAFNTSGTNTSELSAGRNWSVDWTLDGEGTLFIRQAGSSACIGNWYTPGYFPVVAGGRYEGSVYSGAHRCTGYCQILWYDENKTFISTTTVGTNSQQAAGGPTIGGYLRIGGFATAPANAAFARLRLRKDSTVAGQTNSYLFLSRPMFAEARTGQSELSAWADGAPRGAFSTLSQLTSNNISTYIANAAIDTLRLAGQAVTFPVMAKRISNNFGEQLAVTGSGTFATPAGVTVVSIGGTLLEAAGFSNIDVNSFPVLIDISLNQTMNMNWIVAYIIGAGAVNGFAIEMTLYRVVGGVETAIDVIRMPILGHNGDSIASHVIPSVFTIVDNLPGLTTALYRLKLTDLPSRPSIDQFRSVWQYRAVMRVVAQKR